MNKKNIAIVLAAGQGKRMKAKVYKQFIEIAGKPLIYYSLECFQRSSHIDEIILVTGQDEMNYCQSEIVDKYGFDKVKKIIAGGKERYHSVYKGLKVCVGCKYVFIHDGARPFVNGRIIERVKNAVEKHRACVSAVKAKDTIKVADADNFVKSTPNREYLWVVQTPQAFEYDLVYEAYQKCSTVNIENITDDAMVVEAMTNCKIMLVEGDYRNIKVTTPEDLEMAENLIKIY